MNPTKQILSPLRALREQSICKSCLKQLRRAASTQTTVTTSEDLESSSFDAPIASAQDASSFDPLAPSRNRRHQLPASRYEIDVEADEVSLSSIDINIDLPNMIEDH